jgi:hypothetical protein
MTPGGLPLDIIAAVELWLCLEVSAARGRRRDNWRIPSTLAMPLLSSMPSPKARATTSTIFWTALRKKPSTRTRRCKRRMAYPIHAFGPSVTPNDGAKATMSKMVENLTAAKIV